MERAHKISGIIFLRQLRAKGVFRHRTPLHETRRLRSPLHGRMSPVARPPARRAPGLRLRTRIRGLCLQRHIRAAEPHHLPRLPAPQRCPRRPRFRSAWPPRRRTRLPHRRAQRMRHRTPRAELTYGRHRRRRAGSVCRSRPSSPKWWATLSASACARTERRASPHHDPGEPTLPRYSHVRPHTLDPGDLRQSRRLPSSTLYHYVSSSRTLKSPGQRLLAA